MTAAPKVTVAMDVVAGLRTNMIRFLCRTETEEGLCGRTMDLGPHDWWVCPAHAESKFRAFDGIVEIGPLFLR